MIFRIEQEVPQGDKPSIRKEDVVYADPDGPTLSTEELASVRSAATSAAATVKGRRLLTVGGVREEGDGPQPEHVIYTVSRVLESAE